MLDESKQQPNYSQASDPLASAILAQVGLQRSTLFQGAQQREAEAALRSPAWTVRTAAIQALAARGESAPVEPLAAALRDEDESVRAAAAWALGTLGNRTPIEPLIAALNDNAWPVREAAALALKALGRRAPAALLLTAQMDEDSQVREAAGWALDARFGPPPGMYNERTRMMSQPVDFDQQRAYQDPREYQGALYQTPQAYARPRPSLFGLFTGQPGTAQPLPAIYRVIVVLGSLVTLVVVLFLLLLATRDSFGGYNGYDVVAALIALGMICVTIVAINIAFNFRR